VFQCCPFIPLGKHCEIVTKKDIAKPWKFKFKMTGKFLSIQFGVLNKNSATNNKMLFGRTVYHESLLLLQM